MSKRVTKDMLMVVEVVRYALFVKAPCMSAAVRRYRKELHRTMRTQRVRTRTARTESMRTYAENHLRRLSINSRRLRRLEKQFTSWRV